MNRYPSLHILENDLAQVLADVFNDDDDCPFEYDGKDMKELARSIVEKARTKSISSRALLSSNDKTERKAEKIKLAGRSETGVFAQMLLYVRRKLKHRGLMLIKPGDKEWLDIKEACKLATEFSNEVGLPIKEGYKLYLEIGMAKMKNFSPYKFKGLHAAICKTYEAMEELEKDRDREKTEQAYLVYRKHVEEKIGTLFENIKEIPEKFVCFKRAKDEALKLKIGVKDYIRAQFVTMEWSGSLPDPYQLYGEKAVQRAIKYCYEHGITSKKQGGSGIDFKKLKGK